ncbi:MAG: restriction endonuclease subunit S [Nocardioidaceae bacterium]
MSHLPDGWRLVRFRDLGTWYGGGTPAKNRREFWIDGEIPWLSPKDMGPHVIQGTKDHITRPAVTGSSARLVPAGSVAVVVRSGILERTIPVAFVPFETTLNQDMKAVAPREDIEPKWIAWGLRYLERSLLDHTRKAGTTVASLEIPRFLEAQLPVPPLAEQWRIVEILEDHLSRLNAAEALLKGASRRVTSLEAQAVRSALTARDNTEQPRDVFLQPVGVADGELATLALPRGWQWTRLGDISEVVGGVTKDVKKQSAADLVEVPYLRVANVQRGRLDLSRVTSIRVPSAKSAALRLRAGDLLLNEGGDRDKLGRGWIWEDQIANCIHQNHVFRARVRDGGVDPRIVSWAANTMGGPWCERNGKQSVNLASISLTRIRLMPIPLPPQDEQTGVIQAIDSVTAACRLIRSEVSANEAKTSGLKRSLLNAAFSGRL